MALILTFGPISGAHFNPVVTLAERRGCRGGPSPWYVVAQVAGAMLGVWTAHAMFGEPVFMLSHHVRSGTAQWFSEFVATFGLLAVITGCSRRRPEAVPFAVAAYIVAAYWFTASTSFANPAVTIARAFTDTFAGIRPGDVPGFIVAQVLGGMSAALLLRWLTPAALEPSRDNAPLITGGGSMTTVLFACVHNAGRSQMAAAWFNALADPAKARAVSAGTDPGSRVHPEVVAAMSEVGIDLSGAPTTKLTPELAAGASMLITMGCGDQCPVVPGVKRDDWPLEDPKGKPVEAVRAIRDEIRSRVQALVESQGWASR